MNGKRYKKTKKTVKYSLTNTQKNAVKKIINNEYNKRSEWKFYCTNAAGQVNDNGSVADLSAIAQGNTDVTRDGDELRMGKVSLTYNWISSDIYNTCRLIIFQWFEDTSLSGPIVADILSLDATLPVYSCYNTDNAQSYKILFDKIETITADYIVSTGPTVYNNRAGPVRKLKFHPSRKKINFTAGSTDGSGKIYYLAITDSNSTSHPTLHLLTRINYTDS